MEIYTMVNGSTESKMVEGLIMIVLLKLHIMDNGKMVKRTDKVF